MASPLDSPIRQEDVLGAVRARLGDGAFRVFFGGVVPAFDPNEPGTLVLEVPTEFVAGWIRSRYRDALEEVAAALGFARTRVREIVDQRAPLASVDGPAVRERAARHRSARSRQRESLPGVIVRLLGERGFWSLSPGAERQVVELTDVAGSLQVVPSAIGKSGLFEAMVFTGLVTIWANGPRSEPVVVTSAKELADVLALSWHGDLGERLRLAVDLLALTGYRVEAEGAGGGWTDTFTILDRAQTSWAGARTSPNRRMRAVFSEAVWEHISQQRMIRPVDLRALRAIGMKRDLARRLFLFLEASPAPLRLELGLEGIERIVDERLAGSLGVAPDVRKLRQHLLRAGDAIVSAAPRYEAIDVAPREKRGLRRGQPGYVLRVVRRRAGPTRRGQRTDAQALAR